MASVLVVVIALAVYFLVAVPVLLAVCGAAARGDRGLSAQRAWQRLASDEDLAADERELVRDPAPF